MPYKQVPHTADVRIQVTGSTLEELLRDAMRGMMEVMKPVADDSIDVTQEVSIKSIDESSLVIDFLSDVLFHVQTDREIYDDLEVSKLVGDENEVGTEAGSETKADTEADTSTKAELECVIKGHPIQSLGDEIKAVTYHGAEVKRTEDEGWEVTIIFDL